MGAEATDGGAGTRGGDAIGRRFGAWRVEAELGAGAMGVVYRVVHDGDGRRAALKTVRGIDGTLLRGMRREIRALGRLAHPGIVRILDDGLADAVPWYVMELLEGTTLRASFEAAAPRESAEEGATAQTALDVTQDGSRARAPLAPAPAPSEVSRDEGLRRVVALCDALAFLHGEGVVHLDLKPDNVFLTTDGRVVLMDFGLATRVTAGQGRESLDVAIRGAGTVLYISPEQLRGDPLDGRADLYALGAMLYEVSAGRPPFVGPYLSVAFGHLNAPPVPLSDLVPGAPAPLVKLVASLLQKQPWQRPGYAADVRRALVALVGEPATPPGPPPRPFLHLPGMVGRREPLEALRQALARAQMGAREIVLVGGESGVGKTRLALELVHAAGTSKVTAHIGECPARAPGEVAGAPLAAFLGVFHEAVDRCVELGAKETARLFEGRVHVLAACAPELAAVPGADEAPQPEALPARATRARLIKTFVRLLEGLAEGGPLLLLVDDLQWADDATFGVFEALASDPWRGAHGMLLVATYRSDESTAEIAALAALAATDAGAAVRRLELGRLDAASARALAEGMLGADGLAPALVDRVTLESEGNPFFIAEFLRAAVREGVLVREDGRWRVEESEGRRVASLPAPRAIAELVEQRLERLAPAVRAVAEAASVLGREFDPQPLAAMLGRPEVEVLDALLELFATQLAEPHEAGGGRFVHARLHEVTYAAIAPEQRRRLHGAAGRALAAGPRRAGLAATVGQHLRLGPAPAEAIPHLETAAFEALAAGDHRGARALFESLSALVAASSGPIPPAQIARIARGLGDACFSLGDLARAAAQGRRALSALGHTLPQAPLGALVALGREGLQRLSSPPPDPGAREHLEEAALAAQRVAEAAYYALDVPQLVAASLLATSLAGRAGHSAKVTRASAMLGLVCSSLRLPARAAALGDGAIARARAAGDRGSHCFALYARSAALCTAADLALAWDVGTRALAEAESLGDLHEVALAEACVGNAAFFLGDLAASLKPFARIEALAQRASLSQLGSWGLYGQARALVHLGDLDRALALTRRAGEALRGVGDEASNQIVLGLQASAEVGLGATDAARATLERLAGRARAAPGAIFALAPGYSAAAGAALALHRGGQRGALALAREAVGWLAGVARGNAVAEAPAALWAGRVALAEGRRRAGERSLRRAIELASARAMRLEEGLALASLSDPASQARGVAILRVIGASRHVRDHEEHR